MNNDKDSDIIRAITCGHWLFLAIQLIMKSLLRKHRNQAINSEDSQLFSQLAAGLSTAAHAQLSFMHICL